MTSVHRLYAELEGALVDAVGGEPASPGLARRLERVARAVLLRHGLRGARVVARSTPSETAVQVLLPTPGRRVHEIRLDLHQARSS